MRVRIKRAAAWILVVALVLMWVPGDIVYVRAYNTTIYVSKSGGDGNMGTQDSPVKTIEKALELADKGDTINILDVATTEQPSYDEPLCITKAVTISGGELVLSKAGIVLGADVIFCNVSIKLANPVRNAIIANGYSLTLENVKGIGAYPVHVFCGEMTGYSGAGSVPVAGTGGDIVISGENNVLGDIYAGSLSEYGDVNVWGGMSSVTILAGAGGTIGNVYGCGATEPRGQGDGNNMTPDSARFKMTGSVDVNLSGSKPKVVYGKTGGERDANVIFNGGVNLISNLSLCDIESLRVASGVFQPADMNERIDIIINSGGELDLSEVIEDGTTYTVGDFTGAGTLTIGKNDKLKITGTVEGITTFQTAEHRPLDKSTSGVVEYEYVYIDVTDATGEGIFTYTPYESQAGTTLTKVEGEDTAYWMTSKEPENIAVKPENFDVPVTNYVIEQDEINTSGFSVPIKCEIEDTEYISDVPFLIIISKDGGDEVTATGEYDSSYGYTYYARELGLDEIYCSEDWIDDEYTQLLCFITYSSIDSGIYTIEVSVELDSGESVTKDIKLTVKGDSILGDVNADTAVDVKDAVVLKQQLAGIDTGMDMVAADLNKDGEVNTIDAVSLMKYLAGASE